MAMGVFLMAAALALSLMGEQGNQPQGEEARTMGLSTVGGGGQIWKIT